MSVRMNDGGAAAVFASGVLPYPVHADYIALVLYRPCPEQRIPCQHSDRGPVGHTDNGVIILAATHPDGEAQIVAYSQQETYAPPFGYHAFITMLIMPVLAAIGKEVALVIADKAAVRLYKVQPVVEPAVTLQGEASGYGGVLLPGCISASTYRSAPGLA